MRTDTSAAHGLATHKLQNTSEPSDIRLYHSAKENPGTKKARGRLVGKVVGEADSDNSSHMIGSAFPMVYGYFPELAAECVPLHTVRTGTDDGILVGDIQESISPSIHYSTWICAEF
jgi:hypothetical protein